MTTPNNTPAPVLAFLTACVVNMDTDYTLRRGDFDAEHRVRDAAPSLDMASLATLDVEPVRKADIVKVIESETMLVHGSLICERAGHCAMGALIQAAGIPASLIPHLSSTPDSWPHSIDALLWNTYRLTPSMSQTIIDANDSEQTAELEDDEEMRIQQIAVDLGLVTADALWVDVVLMDTDTYTLLRNYVTTPRRRQLVVNTINNLPTSAVQPEVDRLADNINRANYEVAYAAEQGAFVKVGSTS